MPRTFQELETRQGRTARSRNAQAWPAVRSPRIAWLLFTLFLLACGSGGTSPEAPDRAGEARPDAVREMIRAWAAALNRRPLEVASFYTADALLLQPDAAAIAGAEAIQGHLTERLAGLSSFTYRSEERIIDGRVAYERGRFVAAFKGRNPLVGQILHVLVPQPEGGWRIFREVWVPEPMAVP